CSRRAGAPRKGASRTICRTASCPARPCADAGSFPAAIDRRRFSGTVSCVSKFKRSRGGLEVAARTRRRKGSLVVAVFLALVFQFGHALHVQPAGPLG